MSRLGLARSVPVCVFSKRRDGSLIDHSLQRIEVFQETLAVKADDRVRSCVLPPVYTLGENALSQTITEVTLKEPPVIDLGPRSDEGSSIEVNDKDKEE